MTGYERDMVVSQHRQADALKRIAAVAEGFERRATAAPAKGYPKEDRSDLTLEQAQMIEVEGPAGGETS